MLGSSQNQPSFHNLRILNEVKELEKHNPFNIKITPDNLVFSASIDVPIKNNKNDIPQTYHIQIKLPKNYPFDPPHIKFLNYINHPNIHNNVLCYGLMKEYWLPTTTMCSFLDNITKILESADSYCGKEMISLPDDNFKFDFDDLFGFSFSDLDLDLDLDLDPNQEDSFIQDIHESTSPDISDMEASIYVS
jgi:ubiquitin-protein ligase